MEWREIDGNNAGNRKSEAIRRAIVTARVRGIWKRRKREKKKEKKEDEKGEGRRKRSRSGIWRKRRSGIRIKMNKMKEKKKNTELTKKSQRYRVKPARAESPTKRKTKETRGWTNEHGRREGGKWGIPDIVFHLLQATGGEMNVASEWLWRRGFSLAFGERFSLLCVSFFLFFSEEYFDLRCFVFLFSHALSAVHSC